MKTAIYSQDGVTQIVLTPENEWEKLVVEGIETGDTLSVTRGSFYECRGRWVREGNTEESLILRK